MALFKCDWFDPKKEVKYDKALGLVEVNHTSRLEQYEPFVLAYQVDQVYYTPYPSPPRERKDWWVAFKTNPIGTLPVLAVDDEVDDSLPPVVSEYYQEGEQLGADISQELGDESLLHESNIVEQVDPEDMDFLNRPNSHENIESYVAMDSDCSSEDEGPIESDNDSDNDSDSSD